MGSRGDSGASGSDAGFENKTKSKLSKKNQALVDADFNQRGKVKIDQQKILTPTTAIFKGAFKKGSEVTRNFFTDKVLTSEKGMKNLGTTKEEFADMSVSQQESIYGDYLEGRQTGNTDAYGNKLRNDSALANRSRKSKEQPKVKSQMSNTGVKSDLITADKTAPTNVEMTDDEYNIATKRKGRRRTVLTSVTGDTSKPQLSKKTLLGV